MRVRPFTFFSVFLLVVLFFSACTCDESINDPSTSSGQSDDDDIGDDDDSADDDDDNDDAHDPDWYRSVVFMEIFPRSYQDSDGDGIGDLPGLTSKLPYIADLGIGGIWLTPIYPTPFLDSGYDVADYTAINPDYGDMGDFLALLDKAHDLGVRVFLDGVFNHSSYEHEWFVESRSSRDNPKRDWYIWADEPLFDCRNPFPPGAFREQWTFDETTGQYYYHHFLSEMPDLNFSNPEVQEAIKDTLRFWLDLGVDGFRLDVAYLYYEDEQYCDHHPLTHQFLKEMRAVLDEYDDRAMVGEVVGLPRDIIAYLGDGSDELHMIFNFDLTYAAYPSFFLGTPFFIDLLMNATYEQYPLGGQGANFLSNHDFFRDYGLLFRNESLCKLASAMLLTLPGTPFLYYGQEIGMANGTEIVVDYRDSARTPMHWDDSTNAGFTMGEPWIRMAHNHRQNNVKLEAEDPDSLLNHYKRMIRLRNETEVLNMGDFNTVPTGSLSTYAYFRSTDNDSILVVLNFSKSPAAFSLDLRNTPWHGRAGPVLDLFSRQYFTDLDEENFKKYPITLSGYGFAVLMVIENSDYRRFRKWQKRHL